MPRLHQWNSAPTKTVWSKRGSRVHTAPDSSCTRPPSARRESRSSAGRSLASRVSLGEGRFAGFSLGRMAAAAFLLQANRLAVGEGPRGSGSGLAGLLVSCNLIPATHALLRSRPGSGWEAKDSRPQTAARHLSLGRKASPELRGHEARATAGSEGSGRWRTSKGIGALPFSCRGGGRAGGRGERVPLSPLQPASQPRRGRGRPRAGRGRNQILG